MKKRIKTISYQILIIISLVAICIPSIASTASNLVSNEIENNTIIEKNESNTTSEELPKISNETKEMNNTIFNVVENLIENTNVQEPDSVVENITNEEIRVETSTDIPIDIIDMDENILENGIFVDPRIGQDFLNVLNYNSIYTYSLNNNGKLICNYIEKENDYIDTDNETEVDIILKEKLENVNEKIFFTIDFDNTINDGSATKVVLDVENNFKTILLNENYFNSETMNEFHPSLTDYILKGILYQEDNYAIEPMSSFSTTGKSNSSQTVYFGPSSTEYAEIGSVGLLETIWIIGMSNDWYHITYQIGSSQTYKTGYLPKANVINASGPDLYEENLTGGYRVANQQLDVKSYDLLGKGVSIGTVYNTESVTCLYDYGNSDGIRVAYIEFSTSKGTKRGYIENSKLSNPINYSENGQQYDTTVGYVKSNVNLSMGIGSGYVNTGLAVSKDEYVAILGKENNNLYIEYNTKNGRKRAFTTTDYIEPIRHYTNGVANWYPDLPLLYGQKVSNTDQTVYGCPTNQSGTIGSISLGEAVHVYQNHRFNDVNNTYTYIAYNTSNGKKTGYVLSNTLGNYTTVELPEFKDFDGAEKTILQSAGDINGNNKSYMAFYKVGNGQNKLYLVFNQHGWEDAYPGDGVELTRISQQFLTALTDGTHSDILEEWTVCVMCDANPNGILNGEDHSGIGRTVPYSGVDLNRAWPTNNWTPSSVAIKGKKGYTGTNPTEDCLELKQLKLLLENNAPNPEYASILMDIHGWDCEIFGDTKVGKYYNTAETFSTTASGLPFYSSLYNHAFRNDSRSGGSGYLISWAYQKLGVKNTALLELPYPGDAVMVSNGIVTVTKTATADDNNIERYDYAGRFITGTLNLLEGFLLEDE